jgi:hypothetical protein
MSPSEKFSHYLNATVKKNAQTESTNIRLSTDFKINRLLRIIHLFEHLERKNKKMDYSHQKSFLQVQIMCYHWNYMTELYAKIIINFVARLVSDIDLAARRTLKL